MKQVLQSYKTGDLTLDEVPVPALRPNGVLVQNVTSLVSVGTEKLMMDLAKKSLLGKARSRPDLVRQVINKAKVDGIRETYRAAMGRLDTPVPLGYSCAGHVIEVATAVDDFQVGDSVACFGASQASHSEVVSVTRSLAVKIPEGVGFEAAAFAGVGAIALHGVRTAEIQLGDRVVVIGLGLIGLIAVQILQGAGAHVFGVDISADKVKLARGLGMEQGAVLADNDNEDVPGQVRAWSDGSGADAVIIFAGANSSQPIELAAEVARQGARLAVPGMVDLKLDRRQFFDKELKLIVPRSAGPGIYDPQYEEMGRDYPLPYVRWTAQRNMDEFLRMVANGKVSVDPIITHRYAIEEALQAYDLVYKGGGGHIGVLLSYQANPVSRATVAVKPATKSTGHTAGTPQVGLIGAGLFTKSILLPILKKMGDIELCGVVTASGYTARHVAERNGFQYCGSDYQELLDDPNVDSVLITTRHDLHVPMTIAALEKGKHVFVEKPLATTADTLAQVVQAHENHNGHLMVGFNRRYSPFSVRARQALETRKGPAIVHMRVNAGPVPPESWVLDPVEGGGRIIGEMCHFVDLAQYLLGANPIRAYARSVSGDGAATTDDNVVVTLDMSDGSTTSIVYVSMSDRAFPRERVEIFWDGAVCAIDNFKQMSIVKGGKTERTKRWNLDRGHKAELEAFFGMVRGEVASVPMADYAATTMTTFAIVESLKSGMPVEVQSVSRSASALSSGGNGQ
ncbi:MAG: bi-domain-containing oxidoreductase [Chloroflexi bacterium]|nr:bi-domain-containing oxidoreductase [Chloroflexota bacterium]